MSEESISMRPLGQTAVHGSQGISWLQWMTGKTPASGTGVLSGAVAPGRDLRMSAVLYHSGEISPTSRPRARATSRPRILPEKMAAEASAISSASPAAKAARPNSRALR